METGFDLVRKLPASQEWCDSVPLTVLVINSVALIYPLVGAIKTLISYFPTVSVSKTAYRFSAPVMFWGSPICARETPAENVAMLASRFQKPCPTHMATVTLSIRWFYAIAHSLLFG